MEFDLSLEDTAAQKQRVLAPRTKTGVAGYNPYDARPQASNDVQRSRTDLRQLSEWIRLQRQVEALKKEKP